jgi:signal transduction histidine kinase
VFATVVEEVGRLLGADLAHLGRVEPGETVTTVAGWSREGDPPLVGTRDPIEEGTLSAVVLRTGRPARIDSYADVPGPTAALARQLGVRSSVGCPITVQGRPWGLTAVGSRRPEPLAADTEARVAGFTELVATAIANTQARAELAASRTRIVQAADQTRRRIERELHDGVQQRLVALGLELRAAQLAVPTQLGELGAQLARVAQGLGEALEELRERRAASTRRSCPRVGWGPRSGRWPAARPSRWSWRWTWRRGCRRRWRSPPTTWPPTNAAKHAHASVAHVQVQARGGRLRLSVGDDGAGGADPGRGTGLVGLSDRVQAPGGTLTVHSLAGAGARLLVDLPVEVDGD